MKIAPEFCGFCFQSFGSAEPSIDGAHIDCHKERMVVNNAQELMLKLSNALWQRGILLAKESQIKAVKRIDEARELAMNLFKRIKKFFRQRLTGPEKFFEKLRSKMELLKKILAIPVLAST